MRIQRVFKKIEALKNQNNSKRLIDEKPKNILYVFR